MQQKASVAAGPSSGERHHSQRMMEDSFLAGHLATSPHKEVQIFIDFEEDESINLAQTLKQSGSPFIIRGCPGWARFSYKWLVRTPPEKSSTSISTSSSSSTSQALKKKNLKAAIGSLEDGPFYLDTTAMAADIGEEIVPILTPDYDDANPIKGYMAVKDYISQHWQSSTPTAYLHQWQFPLTQNKRTKDLLCNQTEDIDILGMDLLQFFKNSVSDSADKSSFLQPDGSRQKFSNDSPFQYIFMGGTDTFSRLHRDRGGCSILIAPIVGQKEVVMVHRDDGRLIYNCTAPLSPPDYITYPLSAFARTWKTVLIPGDVLVMPAGTFHAARNLSPCLSYSKFHMDEFDFPYFLNSWMNQDAPTIPHSDILWNACVELMHILDFIADPSRTIKSNSYKIYALKYLTLLRHAVQMLTQIASTPGHMMNSINRKASEWYNLLEDIDDSIKNYLVLKVHGIREEPLTESVEAEASNDLSTKGLPKKDGAKRPKHELLRSSASKICEQATCSRDDKSGNNLDDISDDDIDGDVNDLEESNNGLSFPSSGHKRKAAMEVTRENASKIAVLQGPGCGINGMLVWIGRKVLIGRKGRRLSWKGIITDYSTGTEAVKIHYEGFQQFYDEIVLKENIRSLDNSTVKNEDIRAGRKVIALWGTNKDEFPAVLMNFPFSSLNPKPRELPISEVYRGPLIRVRPEQQTNTASDWDRWFVPENLSLF